MYNRFEPQTRAIYLRTERLKWYNFERKLVPRQYLLYIHDCWRHCQRHRNGHILKARTTTERHSSATHGATSIVVDIVILLHHQKWSDNWDIVGSNTAWWLCHALLTSMTSCPSELTGWFLHPEVTEAHLKKLHACNRQLTLDACITELKSQSRHLDHLNDAQVELHVTHWRMWSRRLKETDFYYRVRAVYKSTSTCHDMQTARTR